MPRLLNAWLFVFLAAPSLAARTLDLPPRPAGAIDGKAFAQSISELEPRERETRIRREILSGNVPPFLRELVPVHFSKNGHEAILEVTADYLAVGSDRDYFLCPMTPGTARAIADSIGCALPTPRIVDAIHQAATVKLEPSPIPPSPAMTTVPVFLQHNEMVFAQRAAKPAGGLVAGHKKDVVVAKRLLERPGRVAIYGWHRRDGRPIQPLYAGHVESWVDYSHGVRLVSRRIMLDGQEATLDDVLLNPELAPLLSNEGALRSSRYPTTPLNSRESSREESRLEHGVRVVIDGPLASGPRPKLLVFYALPNGNTIEQTLGGRTTAGDDWRFDIQHIGAQSDFVREALPDREVVVAYLENDLKSWPSWRKAHGDAAIPAILDAVRSRFARPGTRIVLAGHSGGGSLILGYINTLERIPEDVERIVFLDANYAYETGRHLKKLTNWLRLDVSHRLVVLAYDDARALLNGKSFVSEQGGTWGRSRQMLQDFGEVFPIDSVKDQHLSRHESLGGRVRLLLLENPERKILHTVQVERNGFIDGLLCGTAREGVGYQYLGDRAYERFIGGDGIPLPVP